MLLPLANRPTILRIGRLCAHFFFRTHHVATARLMTTVATAAFRKFLFEGINDFRFILQTLQDGKHAERNFCEYRGNDFFHLFLWLYSFDGIQHFAASGEQMLNPKSVRPEKLLIALLC